MKSQKSWAIASILTATLLGCTPLAATVEKPSAAKEGSRKVSKVSRARKPEWLKVAQTPATPSATSEPARRPGRDPFRVLAVRSSDESMTSTLPGKRGLQIKFLRVKGIVKTGSEYLAVVDSPQSSAGMFLHVNDEVSDGRVVAIKDDSVLFQERSVDALGRAYTREVEKRISGSGGISQ